MNDRIKEDGPMKEPPANPFPEEGGPLLVVLALYADPAGSHVRVALNEKDIPEGITVTQVLTNAMRGIVSVGARLDPATFGKLEQHGEAVFEK